MLIVGRMSKKFEKENMMRSAFLIPAVLALTGCNIPALADTPVEVADQTILDERAAIGAELAYRAQNTLLELAVDSGRLKGDLALRAAGFDRQAYAALQAVRSAYRAGNAASYAAALDEARAAVEATLNIIEGN